MFESRTERENRGKVLPQVRVTSDERAAVEWLAEHLSEKDGTSYSLSDVVRIALRRLYEEEHQPAKKPAKPRQKK